MSTDPKHTLHTYREKQSAEELVQKLREVPVRPMQIWSHAKTGILYRIISLALDEKTHKPLVLYKIRVGVGPTWSRPVSDFIERFRHVA